MAGTLSVQKIQGLASSATPTTVEIASGHKLSGAAGSIVAPGHVIQVQYLQYTGTFSQAFSANTSTAVGSSTLIVNITPSSASSIIKLDAHIMHEWSNINAPHETAWFFYRDTTKLAHPAAGSRLCGITPSLTSYQQDATSTPEAVSYSYFDSPNTTSQITYKVGVVGYYANTVYINRTVNDTDSGQHERGISFISATEIAQ